VVPFLGSQRPCGSRPITPFQLAKPWISSVSGKRRFDSVQGLSLVMSSNLFLFVLHLLLFSFSFFAVFRLFPTQKKDSIVQQLRFQLTYFPSTWHPCMHLSPCPFRPASKRSKGNSALKSETINHCLLIVVPFLGTQVPVDHGRSSQQYIKFLLSIIIGNGGSTPPGDMFSKDFIFSFLVLCLPAGILILLLFSPPSSILYNCVF